MQGFEIDRFNIYGLTENAKHSTCPICSEMRKKKTEKCATLYWETGLGYCNHCQTRFQLHTYKAKKQEPKKTFVLPQFKNNTKLSDKAVQWLQKRGISQSTLNLMQVGEGNEWMPQTQKEENTIQFNYFRDGILINTKFRDGRKNFKLVKDAEKIFYNLDSIKMANTVIICEGEIDCLSFIEAGAMNCVSVPNGSTLGNSNLDYLDNCIEYFENKERIYLALDNDEAGQNTTKEFIRRLGADKCFLIDFGKFKDANEYLVANSAESLLNLISEAKEIPIDGVSSVGDWREKFENYLVNGMQKGFVTGIKSFDKKFSTYTGQFIVVTGIPASGKSDWVDMMCVGYNKEYGWKIAFASPENKPNEIHAGKLISKMAGQWVRTQDQVNSRWFNEGIHVIHNSFKFIDLDVYDLEAVLEKARQMVFKFGIKVLVIDPFNKVRLKASLNKRDTEYANDYLLMIDNFCRKYDVLVILIAHPRKPSGSESRGYEPTFYDIKGGGEFFDMSPHGLLVHRDFNNKKVKVKNLKVKFNHLGETEAFSWYEWNLRNGRYTDFEDQNEDPNNVRGSLEDNSNWLAGEMPTEEPKQVLIKVNNGRDDEDFAPF